VSPFVFAAPTGFTVPELATLDERAQYQVMQTIERLRGVACASLDDCVRAIRDELHVDDAEVAIERYPIGRTGEAPSYELWLYQGEHGLVFAVDAWDATAVHCVQRHFWSVDDEDGDAVALAAALDAAAF
jgi:hypothetical protein